jgi:putative addiction module killer protein
MIEVRNYETADGVQPVAAWLGSLRDSMARLRIAARIECLGKGLPGDWKNVGGSVCELRIDAGPGYRVYYAQHGNALILLLCGGDKRTQTRDIERAHDYWKDYQARR